MVVRQCREKGWPLPEEIKNKPELLPGLDLYYLAFFDISDCRSMGMQVGPIPWTVVRTYANELGFDQDQTEALHYHIRMMDDEFLRRNSTKES